MVWLPTKDGAFFVKSYSPWLIGEWNHSPMVLFGILRCPRELAYLLGKQLRARFWLWINSKRGVGGFLIDVTCVRKKKKVVTIFSSIVRKLVCCGSWSLHFLAFSGCWVIQLERSFWVGTGPLWVKRGRRLGRLLCCIYFGHYSESEIGGLLTTLKARIKQLKKKNCIYFWIGLDCTLRADLYHC